MNLIQKLGLEKCKAIVDGAPEWAGAYNTKSKSYASDAWFYHEILLSDLRTAIANHGTTTNEGTDNLSHFDHCADIANHISPNTKVFER